MNSYSLLIGLINSGLLAGTPLLLAAIGEICAERSGVLNLGIEGMMLFAAMTGFWAALVTGSAGVGLVAGVLAGTALSAIHAVGVISCKGDPIVSGLALGFFGAGLSSVLGSSLVGRSAPSLPDLYFPILAEIPVIGKVLFSWNAVVPLAIIFAVITWALLERTRFGLHALAAGQAPEAATKLGISVSAQRYVCTLFGGAMAGMAGASLSLAVTPGWVDNITAGQGWITIGLVVFSRLKPWRGAVGAFLFGALRRAVIDLQGVPSLPFFRNPNLGYFLAMIPYLATIAVLMAEGLAQRKRAGR